VTAWDIWNSTNIFGNRKLYSPYAITRRWMRDGRPTFSHFDRIPISVRRMLRHRTIDGIAYSVSNLAQHRKVKILQAMPA